MKFLLVIRPLITFIKALYSIIQVKNNCSKNRLLGNVFLLLLGLLVLLKATFSKIVKHCCLFPANILYPYNFVNWRQATFILFHFGPSMCNAFCARPRWRRRVGGSGAVGCGGGLGDAIGQR